ncbi:metallophosphoesterase [Pelagicoccus sp. SDUM812003]|uniref:metallophosphoesterase n=1 Tax=Pelagicoccus sp. SDUM812003 TaxID=3041267 RepID=UPI00280C8FA9|nr:metallophosphoesterase [Pelagicoccus sp. SDUM812003]MDQ8204078.1 hypothetical protein [Pelagicoccus sp. SDUM812003]
MNPSGSSSLVIPDIHQNILWTESILQAEADSVDRIIFLGDYFDPKLPCAATAEETAIYISSLKDRFQENRFTFLVGNHDLPYLYDIQQHALGKPVWKNPYSCNAYDPDNTRGISQALSKRFLESLEPLTLAHGWLISHAGVHEYHLESYEGSPEESFARYRDELRSKLKSLPSDRDVALAGVGPARGGIDAFGGVTWLDWHGEFEDTLPWPQIVGHTILEKPDRNERSWNLDTRAGHYGILSDSDLKVKPFAKELS